MAEITCSRCGNTAPGLGAAPFAGEQGERIRDQVCASCWREWMGMQVKVINEYRLSSGEPKHMDFLMEQMRVFLNLREQ